MATVSSRSGLSIAAARERVLAAARPLEPRSVPVAQALDLILATEVHATGTVPPFPSSAMDGYAVPAGPAGSALRIVAESRAGSPSQRPVGPGEAVRISTGAAVPEGATAVIRQEDTDTDGTTVTPREPTSPGQNIRAAGEVMRPGDAILAPGTPIGPAEVGAAVTAGAAELLVHPLPRLQVLVTGDELRQPGAALQPGEIHNSNGPMLVAFGRGQAQAPSSVRLPDELAATEAALDRALSESDVVVVSGGVSVGPHDHVKPALARLGVEEVFWGVALQPGRPTWFGTHGSRLVFGLPGNPVSAAVTFTLFVAPALRALAGRPDAAAERVEAELAVAVTRNPSREQALRVRLERRDGVTLARPNGPQGSHVITSLLGAQALALIPAGEGELPAGSVVPLLALPR
jgi:molybdopterin molybdotransferase